MTSFDVFLSHNSKDKPVVRELAEALHARGLKVWLDEWELVPGRPWQQALEEIIRTVKSAAVLIGKDGLGPWEEPEMRACLQQFVQRQLPVIPVLLPDAPEKPSLPLFLTGLTWVDCRGDGITEAILERLEWGITGRKPIRNTAAELEVFPTRAASSESQPAKESDAKPFPLVANKMASATTPPYAAATGDVITNSIGMRLKLIPAGEFTMGSPASLTDHSLLFPIFLRLIGRGKETPQHTVRITKPFYVGVFAVTQKEYQRVIGHNPSKSKGNDQRPIDSVSWYDAVNFCNQLSDQEGLEEYYKIDGKTVSINGGLGYRLPTEAEWEYACRAGTTTKWSCGDDVKDLDAAAWFWSNSTNAVGTKKPNPWGLYDMHGNVFEWCWDWCGEYENARADSPNGPASGKRRVLRGGAFYIEADSCRSAYRIARDPGFRIDFIGFRISRTFS